MRAVLGKVKHTDCLSRSIWTPGPNSTEVFGPPLKFLDPPMYSHFEP